MGSLGRKINKNANQFREFDMLKVYGHMTPEQIQRSNSNSLDYTKKRINKYVQ